MNACQCCLKLKSYREAKELADAVLSKKPSNPKMMFRKGKALMHLGEYKDSFKILIEAAKVLPNDVVIRQKIDKVKKLMKEYEEKEKVMFMNKLGPV